MKVIAEAIVEAANLAYLAREDSMSLALQRSAEQMLALLHKATDRIIELRSGQSAITEKGETS